MVKRGIPHPCRGAFILDAQPGVLPPATILQPSGLNSVRSAGPQGCFLCYPSALLKNHGLPRPPNLSHSRNDLSYAASYMTQCIEADAPQEDVEQIRYQCHRREPRPQRHRDFCRFKIRIENVARIRFQLPAGCLAKSPQKIGVRRIEVILIGIGISQHALPSAILDAY